MFQVGWYINKFLENRIDRLTISRCSYPPSFYPQTRLCMFNTRKLLGAYNQQRNLRRWGHPPHSFISDRRSNINFRNFIVIMDKLFYILLSVHLISATEVKKYGTCSSGTTWPGPTRSPELDCMPREQLVKLNLPNQSYDHVAPDHVFVSRCGGSCGFER